MSFVYLTTDVDGNAVINVQSSDPNDEGAHDMALAVTLGGSQIYQHFSVVIVDCTITGVQLDVTQPIELDFAFPGPVASPLPNPTPTPDFCTHQYIFDGPFYSGTTDRAPFGRVDGENFVVDTDDAATLHGQQIEVDLLYEPNGPNTVGKNTIAYKIRFSACS